MLALWLPIVSATAQYEFKSLTIGGGGYVTGVVVHPTEANLVYARTDVGGAYRWDASARKWIQLITANAMPDGVLNFQNEQGPGVARHAMYAVESIAVDPSNPNVLYVAAGDGLSESSVSFLLKSTDRGNSFVLTNLKGVQMNGGTNARTYGERLVVDPKNSNNVYFGSRNDGVWRSTNAGIDWTQVAASKVPFGGKLSGTDVGIVSMVVDDQSGNPSRVYAASVDEGIFRSDDGGQNWSKIYDGGLVTEMECVGGVLFASVRNVALKKYTPQGGWTDIIPNNDIYIDDIAVDPTNNNIIYAVDQNGFEDFYRSTDQGATWTTLITDTRSEVGRNNFRSNDVPWVSNSTVREWLSPGNLVIDPHNTSRMWFAEGMGMWVSNDISNSNNAPTFDNISQGIEEMVATDVVATDNTVTMMTWDRAGFVKQKSNINGFPTAQIGLTNEFTTGVSVEAAPGNPNFLTAVISDHRGCCGDGNFSGYSEDGGQNWTKFGSINGETNNPSVLKFGEAVTSATDVNNMVWVSRQNQNTELYYSRNKGASWTKSTLASNGYYNSSFTFLTSKKVLTSDAVIGGKFYSYAWQPGRIFVSTDQGATWDYASASPNLPSTVWHGQLKAAPGKANHLWFSTGYDHRNDPSERGLFFSPDGGTNFTQIPDVQDCWAVGFGKAQAGTDYATIFMYGIVYGEWGLYRSTDQGGSWDKLVDYPLGLFDIVTAVSGDPSIFGRVYIGYKGNSFVYGQGDDVPDNPTGGGTGEGGDPITLEAENYTNKSSGTGAFAGANWQSFNDSQASNGQYMSVPNNNEQNAQSSLDGPHMDYAINLAQSGSHYLWLRFLGPTPGDDSCIPAVDGQSKGVWSTGSDTQWGWKKYPLGSLTAGSRTLSIYMREDGLQIDQLVVTDDENHKPWVNARQGTASSKAELQESALPSLNVYPNPSPGSVQIVMTQDAEVQVYNSLGKLIMRRRLDAGETTVDLSSQPRGLYTISTTIQGNRQVRRLILK